jgi:3-hydroxyacyl-[acyl-carrier-protein] dehydratase
MSDDITCVFPLDREAVMEILPHRDPMLFIESVLSANETTIHAQTRVNPEWDVFKGHFPELPIMPGVLLIETMAQAGALILGLKGAVADGSFVGFTGVEQAKFRRAVKPNDVMDIYVELVRERRGFYKFEGRIDLAGELAAELKFAAAQMSL